MNDENYDGDYNNIIDELEEEIHQAEYFNQDFRDSISVWTLRRAVELLKLYRSKVTEKGSGPHRSQIGLSS